MNAIPKAVATALNPPNLSPEAILVRDALIEAGLETPMVPTDLTRDEKYLKIKGAMGEIMAVSYTHLTLPTSDLV